MTELRGTGVLVRLVASRDWLRLLAWVASLVLLVVITATSTKGIYDTQAKLDDVARATIDNPAALAFNGPAQALDTVGGQVAFQIGAFGLVLVGLMTLLLVGRVTRGEEDSGRLELVRSMPVGRHAPLAAGLLVVVAADVAVAVLTIASLIATDLPAHGSIVLGASYLAFGLLFVGITAVTAQVSENPRVTTGAAGAVLGASFALRAAGDAGDGTLSWLSPMGWAQRARPYAGERWWPLLALVVLGVCLIGLAVALAERRDFGSGMVAPRPGPPRAAPWLASPLGLAVRLHRGAAGWWTVAVVSLALVYGTLAESIDDFIGDNEGMADVLASEGGASLVDSYFATSLVVIALLATGPGLQIAMRLRTEESGLRVDALLATPISRPAWLGSHLLVALAAGGLACGLGGAALGLGHAVTGGGAGEVTRLMVAALAYVPAVWVLTGLAVTLFGFVPRFTAGVWVALAGCFVIAMFGPLLDLPGWVLALSPFHHVPGAPADAVRVLPLVVLGAVTAGLVAIGVSTFRSRDVLTS